MPFKTAYLKLTLFYALIVMTISISFSFAIYKISYNELGRGLNQQTKVIHDIPIDDFTANLLPDFEKIRAEQLEQSNNNLKTNLIYFNLLILLLSSAGSYFLAKKTLEPIEEAMESQNRFTADASHELRTPLTAMKSEIEVSLRDKNFNIKDAKALLQSNLEEVEKLETLSGALLKLARMDENIQKSFEEISLEETIVDAYQRIEKRANEKSIEFDNNLKDIQILGDKQNLTELFVILLDNAIKYSPEKSKISITIKKEDHHAIVEIKDQGVGIKSSDLPYIFNRFYRADSSRSREKINGYGLGLSIAKSIIELHQGDITVKSKIGTGSTFIVELPRKTKNCKL